MKTYNENHKETIKERAKRYYEENKAKAQERKRQTVICECGNVVRKDNKTAHLKTLKHQNYISEAPLSL